MAQLAVGVDVGAWSVKLVAGRMRMKRVEILERREAPIERDEDGKVVEGAVDRAIAEVTAGLDRRGLLVFSALPVDDVLLRTVEVPKVASRRLDAIITREVEDDLPIDVQEAVIDHIDRTVEGRPMLQCIVAAATRERVGDHIELLEKHGLDPAEVGVGAATYSDLSRMMPALASPEPEMVVDIGARRTDIAIIAGGETVALRTVSVGGDDFTRAVADRFGVPFHTAEDYKTGSGWLRPGEPPEQTGVPPELAPLEDPDGQLTRSLVALSSALREALVRIAPQVRQTMTAFAARTGKRVTRVLVSGGASEIDGLRETLAEMLGVEVVALWSVAQQSMGLRPEDSRFLTAISLAWRALAAPEEQRFDLRKGPFLYKGQARATRRRWVRAVVAAAALLVGWTFYNVAHLSSLDATERRQQDRLAELTKKYLGEEIRDFSRAEKAMSSAKPLRTPMPSADAFDFVTEMSRRIPEEIIHDVEQLEIKPGKVNIRGVVDTITARDEIVARLEEYTDCVKAISKGKTTQSPKDNRQKYTLDLETECP